MSERYLEMPTHRDSIQYVVWASGLAKSEEEFDLLVNVVREFGAEMLQVICAYDGIEVNVESADIASVEESKVEGIE